MLLFSFMTVAFGGVGVFLLYCERKLIYKGIRSYKWPRVKAVIEDQRDNSIALSGYYFFGWGTVRLQEIAYIYKFKVGDHAYHSSTYCFGGHSDNIRATYVIGQHVLISYNPQDPREAVIKPGLTAGALIGLLPLFFSILGLLMIIFPALRQS